MIRLFLSFNFKTDKGIADTIRQQLSPLGVECTVVGDITKDPPPDVVRSTIFACDAFLAIVSAEKSDWVQNEIGIAYAASKKIYGLVEEGVSVSGLLPRVTSYKQFRRDSMLELKKTVAKIASELTGDAANVGLIEPAEILTSTLKAGSPFSRMPGGGFAPTIDRGPYEFRNRGSVTISFRPPRLPSGDFVLIIYVPPEFDLGRVIADPDNHIVRDLPQEVCRIVAGRRKAKRYQGFPYIETSLSFPEALSTLSDGWVNLKLLDVTAPAISGRYAFYGEGRVAVGSPVAETSPFEFEPIVVKGEISPAILSGTIFTSKNTPFEGQAIIRAVGIAVDPYDPTYRSTGRPVEGRFYMMLRDRGRYNFSLAPGIYDVYASALDGVEYRIAAGIRVLEATTLDGFLSDEPS